MDLYGVVTFIAIAVLFIVASACGSRAGVDSRTQVDRRESDRTTAEGARFHREIDGATNWLPMASAPRDGSIVEIRCTYGVAPSYGLFAWKAYAFTPVLMEWRSVGPHNHGDFSADSERSLTWRPFSGSPETYVDPTHGLQDDMAYWRGAAAAAAGLQPDAFEGIAEKNRKERERFGDGDDAPFWPTSKWNGSFTLHRGVWVDDSAQVPSARELDRIREAHQRKRVSR